VPVSPTAAVCGGCGTILTEETRVRADPPAVEDRPEPAGPTCPSCSRGLPGPDEPVCPFCGTILTRPRGGVELRFEAGTVVVPVGDVAVIGRHGTHDSDRLLGGCEYVSRRHVVVRVADDGTAHVREERPSTNGAFVDGRRLGSEWWDLPDGAQLRLGSRVAATVRYGSGSAGPAHPPQRRNG
jgi:hypothetical protein